MFTNDGGSEHLNMKKFDDILKLLLSAGYFRARVEGLTMFDKVSGKKKRSISIRLTRIKTKQILGGLCWCIAASGKGVDASILFNENIQIGKKLKLAEKVCKVLIKMKCKAELLPHQIQGLDFGKLYPVVKWLVQQVYDFRTEHGEMIRDYSNHHFEKHAKIETDTEHEIAFLHDVQSQYQRQRVRSRCLSQEFH